MFNKIKNFFDSIKFTSDLIKAYDLDAKGRYSEALNILEKYALIEGKIFPDYYIFKASI